MPYEPHDIPETVSILGIAFVVGVIAQFLRQKTDIEQKQNNIMWMSLASGFSAMVTIGLFYEYTSISVPFLVGISGLAGWAGVAILSKLSNALITWVTAKMNRHLGVNAPVETPLALPPPVQTNDDEGVNTDDSTITRMGDQNE